jgi:acetoin utilization deacetylase AcuC-like enzyme
MRFGYREVSLQHETGPRHPDSASRLRAIKRALSERHSVEYVAAPPVDRDEITTVHDPEYVDEFEEFCERGGGRWDKDTVASKRTWDAALASAGLARWVGESALEGSGGRDTPFALCRPPGHHAVVDDAMGFCFLNNTAIAARSSVDSGAADRVAVLDIDVHHGNGTQDIFYGDGDVFYISVHEDGLFPDSGEIEETGDGDGRGANMNVPLPSGSGHPAYLETLDRVVSPALGAFDPDLLLVSAGFDTHEHDPISRTQVSTEGIGRITERLRTLSTDLDAPLGFVLEGGYELDPLSESVQMVHEVFDGYQPETDDGPVVDGVDGVLEAVQSRGFRGL